MYRGSAAKIVKKVGDWVKIKSGQVEGYIMSDYLAIGYSAEKMVDKFGTKIATINTETLKVREAKNTVVPYLLCFRRGKFRSHPRGQRLG